MVECQACISFIYKWELEVGIVVQWAKSLMEYSHSILKRFSLVLATLGIQLPARLRENNSW